MEFGKPRALFLPTLAKTLRQSMNAKEV